MIQTFKKIAGYVFPALLILLGIYLCFNNYQSETNLLGWDSLHPEYNFFYYFKRIFFGVWREEQGLGVLSAHSHMADISRVFFVWLLSFFVSSGFLRYLFVFICLSLGPLGVYFFLRASFKKENLGVYLASFLGAVFYLLNLITLQHFLVPFEMFCVQYAILPWIFLFTLKYLSGESKKSILFYCLAVIFSSAMAYASALYWAFFVCFLIFLFIYWLVGKDKWKVFKRIILIIFIQIALNAYWVAPNIYSTLKGSEEIVASKINTLFSPEAFLRNQEYGNYKDIILGKNFLFDWRVFNFKSGEFEDLMTGWISHLDNPFVEKTGYLLFLTSLLGILVSLAKRNKVGISLIPVLVFCLFFLFNTNSFLGGVYSYLVDRFDIFKEGFRMPFTKFSILYQFALSFYFSYFFYFIFSLFSKNKVLKFFNLIISAGVVFLLVLFCLPVFRGELIGKVVKTNLPNEYLELFNWFKNREGRIAKLPIYTFWGWEYHSWKYEGSGFLTYGLENPILDRDFDRWSPYNETFFNEASYVLYNKDKESLLKVFNKYKVRYLLLDESVINAGGTESLLFIPQIKEILAEMGDIKEVYRSGFLSVYEVNTGNSTGVYAPSGYSLVNADFSYSLEDWVYKTFGDYVFDEESTGYPFSNLEAKKGISFNIDDSVGVKSLVIDNTKSKSKVILPVENEVSEDFSQKRGFEKAYNCDLKKVGSVKKEYKDNFVYYGAEGGGVSCDYFYYPELKRNKSYLLHIKGENISGRSLKIYLQNLETGRMDLEELLPSGGFDSYYVLYPTLNEDEENPGYTLNVETRSFGRIKSENKIEKIEFIPLDLGLLRGIYTKNQEPERVLNNLTITEEIKLSPTNYLVETKEEGLLVLGQGYDEGWNAYKIEKNYQKWFPFLASRPYKQVKVNSWENGFIITDGSAKVAIVFWPQYLEWGGMFLGILIFIVVLASKRSEN